MAEAETQEQQKTWRVSAKQMTYVFFLKFG